MKWPYVTGDATLISLARSYAASNDLSSISSLLHSLPLLRRPLPEPIFLPLLLCFSRLRLPSLSLRLFHRMLPLFRSPPSLRSHNAALLSLVSSSSPFPHALSFHLSSSAHHRLSPDLLTLNLLLKSHSQSSLKILPFFREFTHRHSLRPDAYSYATVMDALVRDGRVEEAVLLLSEMSVEGCPPTEVNYNILIRGLCGIGDVRRAGKLVKNMLLKGCRPTRVTYNTILRGLFRKGKVDVAMGIVESMMVVGKDKKKEKEKEKEKEECLPDEVTYGTIVDGLVKAGRIADVEKMVGLMEENGHIAGQFVYSSLITGLFRSGRADDAMKVWRVMIGEKGVKPNTVLYTNLIDGICRSGRMEEAEEAFGKMLEDCCCVPNTLTYSSMVKGYFKAGMVDKAVSTWEDMINAGLQPTRISYTIFLSGLCNAGRLEDGMEVWKGMLETGCQPDVIAYTAIIKGLCDAGRVLDGIKFFYDMLARRKQPDVVLYNILFSGFCKSGNLPGAMSLLGNMVDGDVDGNDCDPDEVTCNVFLGVFGGGEKGREFLDGLVVRLCKRERSCGVARILVVMLRRNYVPLVSTWDKVVRVICKRVRIRRSIDKCWGKIASEVHG